MPTSATANMRARFNNIRPGTYWSIAKRPTWRKTTDAMLATFRTAATMEILRILCRILSGSGAACLDVTEPHRDHFKFSVLRAARARRRSSDSRCRGGSTEPNRLACSAIKRMAEMKRADKRPYFATPRQRHVAFVSASQGRCRDAACP